MRMNKKTENNMSFSIRTNCHCFRYKCVFNEMFPQFNIENVMELNLKVIFRMEKYDRNYKII